MPLNLIKNATLVSMDNTIGNPTATDILIDGEKIAAVGKQLNAAGATVVDTSHFIVTPGYISAHIRTWELPLRGIGAGWLSSRDYHATMPLGGNAFEISLHTRSGRIGAKSASSISLFSRRQLATSPAVCCVHPVAAFGLPASIMRRRLTLASPSIDTVFG